MCLFENGIHQVYLSVDCDDGISKSYFIFIALPISISIQFVKIKEADTPKIEAIYDNKFVLTINF